MDIYLEATAPDERALWSQVPEKATQGLRRLRTYAPPQERCFTRGSGSHRILEDPHFAISSCDKIFGRAPRRRGSSVRNTASHWLACRQKSTGPGGRRALGGRKGSRSLTEPLRDSSGTHSLRGPGAGGHLCLPSSTREQPVATLYGGDWATPRLHELRRAPPTVAVRAGPSHKQLPTRKRVAASAVAARVPPAAPPPLRAVA